MNRFALVAAAALTAGTLSFAAPATANTEVCATAPGALRAAAAANTDASAQRKALGLVATGEKLCEARNRTGATAKFKVAAKALGVDYASLTTPVAAAQ
jgi:hypothetical protein